MEEKRGPRHLNGISKQNADASLQLPRGPGREGLGGWEGHAQGQSSSWGTAFYSQPVTGDVTSVSGGTGRADLFWFGINTITKVILKQLSRLRNKTFCIERDLGGKVN